MLNNLMNSSPWKLTSEEVQKKNNEEYVLVNVNRLYLCQAHIVQEEEPGEDVIQIMQIINEAIGSLEDEKYMFVKMSVENVKKCFNEKLLTLPANSFKKCMNN